MWLELPLVLFSDRGLILLLFLFMGDRVLIGWSLILFVRCIFIFTGKTKVQDCPYSNIFGKKKKFFHVSV